MSRPQKKLTMQIIFIWYIFCGGKGNDSRLFSIFNQVSRRKWVSPPRRRRFFASMKTMLTVLRQWRYCDEPERVSSLSYVSLYWTTIFPLDHEGRLWARASMIRLWPFCHNLDRFKTNITSGDSQTSLSLWRPERYSFHSDSISMDNVGFPLVWLSRLALFWLMHRAKGPW